MCHRYEALPAVPPIAGAAVDVEDLTLTASDGVEFAAFRARAETAGGPAIVVLPDVRGLFHFYEELAVRFAEAGVEAVAIDYFGRTDGVGKRDAEFDFWPHVRSTSPEGIAADVAAAGHGLSGAIGFYGHPTREGLNGGASPLGRVDDVSAPLLGLMGGADDGIPRSEVDKFAAALDARGTANEFITYEGAPHSFFDRSYDDHQEACADAWTRVQAFISANS